MNEIIETIMKQINWRVLHLMGFQFVRMNDETLRVHRDNRNLDIKYNYGTDLYDLTEHTILKDLTVETEEVENVFFDQLQDIIGEFFNMGEVVRCPR
jgi:hypothetical protein